MSSQAHSGITIQYREISIQESKETEHGSCTLKNDKERWNAAFRKKVTSMVHTQYNMPQIWIINIIHCRAPVQNKWNKKPLIIILKATHDVESTKFFRFIGMFSWSTFLPPDHGKFQGRMED